MSIDEHQNSFQQSGAGRKRCMQIFWFLSEP